MTKAATHDQLVFIIQVFSLQSQSSPSSTTSTRETRNSACHAACGEAETLSFRRGGRTVHSKTLIAES